MFKLFTGIVGGWTAARALDKSVENPIAPPTIAEVNILLQKATDLYQEIAKKIDTQETEEKE